MLTGEAEKDWGAAEERAKVPGAAVEELVKGLIFITIKAWVYLKIQMYSVL